MADKDFAEWVETALWIRTASPLELIWKSARIPLVLCTIIVFFNGLIKLIGG